MEQWHLLANLGSGLVSEGEPVQRQESSASQNSATSANMQDSHPNDDQKEKVRVRWEGFLQGLLTL